MYTETMCNLNAEKSGFGNYWKEVSAWIKGKGSITKQLTKNITKNKYSKNVVFQSQFKILYPFNICTSIKNKLIKYNINYMAYGTRRFNVAFTRALQ